MAPAPVTYNRGAIPVQHRFLENDSRVLPVINICPICHTTMGLSYSELRKSKIFQAYYISDVINLFYLTFMKFKQTHEDYF